MEDWFVTVDLKDAYFYIQVVQRQRRFLRFAFGGKAYQYKVLPFGLALAPRTFTTCMDAALAPLRLQGIRVLNYLDDWLILAHSRELVSCHRNIVLRHIRALGLRTNAKKSVLSPSPQTVFLGVHLDSVKIQARLAPARIFSFNACLARFNLGRQNRCDSPSPHDNDGCVNDRLGRSLLGQECGVWTEEFLSWHINCLELRAVFLALIHFLNFLRGCHVIVRTDNMAMVSHKSPRGLTVALPELACVPSPPLVSGQVPLLESSSCSESFEPCS